MKIYRREPWSNRQDEVLKAAVTKYGFQNWSRVCSMIPGRRAEECESRWNEYLSPAINHQEWSKAEEGLLGELVLTWGSNWRTVATQLPGRTATQCQAKHGKLLERAAALNADAGAGAAGEGADEAQVRFAQVDLRPEVRAARHDTVDADQTEKLMLDEARARLANTKGRKALRKEKEKAMNLAKQRTQLLHQRELRAAASVVQASNRIEGGEDEQRAHEDDDDDDFLPISTADINRSSKNKTKQIQQGAKNLLSGDESKNAKSEQERERQAHKEILEKAKQLTTSAKELAAEAATNNLNNKNSSNNTNALFSFNNSKSVEDNNNNQFTSRQGTSIENNNKKSNIVTAGGLVIPKALQEKRKRELELAQKIKQQQKAAVVVPSSSLPATASASTLSSTSLIAAAIRDGGRTKKEQDAINRSGASMSFVEWLTRKENAFRNQNSTVMSTDSASSSSSSSFSSYYSIPNPFAIQGFLMTSARNASFFPNNNSSFVEDADKLILERVASIATDDHNIHQQQQNNNKNNIIPSFSFFTSPSTNTANNQHPTQLLTQWAEDCGLQDISDAAQMIEDEYISSTAKEGNAQKDNHDTIEWEVTPQIAQFASNLANQIISNTNEYKQSQKRIQQLSGAAKSEEKNNHLITEQMFARVCQDNEIAHDEAVKAKIIALVTSQVRLWEEKCLMSAYHHKMAELNQVRLEADAALF